MKRMSVLILALLLLFSACSAEIVKDLPPEEIQPTAAEAVVEIESGTSVRVSFPLVPYSAQYGYSVSSDTSSGRTKASDEYQVIPFSNLSISGGLASFLLESSDLPVTGAIMIYAENRSGSRVQIASADYALSLEGIVPDVYLSRRNETSAELRTGSETSSLYNYSVKLSENDSAGGEEIIVFNEKSGILLLNSLKPDKSYTAVVSHSLDGETYSDATLKIEIPEYDASIDASIEFSISKGVLSASNVTGSSVTLYKKDSLTSDQSGDAVETVLTAEGRASIAASSLPSLESGYFYFATDSAYSNVIEYTVPVTVKRITNNWKSADLEIDFAEDVSSSTYDIVVSGASVGAAASFEDGIVRISNLDSNTGYEAITLKFNSKDGSVSESVGVAITTNSFAGTYEWTGNLKGGDQNTNFRIVVTDHSSGTSLYPSVPEASDAPYYVYFDSDPVTGDKSIIEQGLAGQTLRIMPLVDVKAGEPATPDGGVSCTVPGDAFAKQNAAYLANGYKWKITSYKNDPNYATTVWYISPEDYDVNALKDVVETITVSGAKLLGGGLSNLLKTTTTFSFIEADTNDDGIMEPFVKFKNVGSFFVSVGLVKNGTLRDDVEESWASEINKDYVWYLEKVSD